MEEKRIIITVAYMSNKGMCYGRVTDITKDNYYKVKGIEDGIVFEIERKFTHIVSIDVEDIETKLNYNGALW